MRLLSVVVGVLAAMIYNMISVHPGLILLSSVVLSNVNATPIPALDALYMDRFANIKQQPSRPLYRPKYSELRFQGSQNAPIHHVIGAKRSIDQDQTWTLLDARPDKNAPIRDCVEVQRESKRLSKDSPNPSLLSCLRPEDQPSSTQPIETISWTTMRVETPSPNPGKPDLVPCPPCPTTVMPSKPWRGLPLRPAYLAVDHTRYPSCRCLYPRDAQLVSMTPNTDISGSPSSSTNDDNKSSKFQKRNNGESKENPKLKPNEWHWLFGPFHTLRIPDWWVWYEGDQNMPERPSWSPIRDEDAHDQRLDPKYVDTVPNATDISTTGPEASNLRTSNFVMFTRPKGQDPAEKMDKEPELVTQQHEFAELRAKGKALKLRNKKMKSLENAKKFDEYKKQLERQKHQKRDPVRGHHSPGHQAGKHTKEWWHKITEDFRLWYEELNGDVNGGQKWLEWFNGPWTAKNWKQGYMTGSNIYIDLGGMQKPWPEVGEQKDKDWRKWIDWGANAPGWIRNSECPHGYDGPQGICWL